MDELVSNNTKNIYIEMLAKIYIFNSLFLLLLKKLLCFMFQKGGFGFRVIRVGINSESKADSLSFFFGKFYCVYSRFGLKKCNKEDRFSQV